MFIYGIDGEEAYGRGIEDLEEKDVMGHGFPELVKFRSQPWWSDCPGY